MLNGKYQQGKSEKYFADAEQFRDCPGKYTASSALPEIINAPPHNARSSADVVQGPGLWISDTRLAKCG